MKLDSKDRRILDLLQRDSTISNADLANAVGMSTSACWRKVRALEEAKIIERYGAYLNPVRAGLGFQAIVHVQLTRHDPDKVEEFIHAVNRRPDVVECFATTGQSDYHLRVLCRDLAAYNTFLEGFLFKQTAVESAQTNVVLRDIKKHSPIPV